MPDDVWRHILSLRTDLMQEEMIRRQRVLVGHQSFHIQAMTVCRPSDFWTSQHIYINVHCLDERGSPHELRADLFHYSCLGEDRLSSMSVHMKDDTNRRTFSGRWEYFETPNVPVSVMGMDLGHVFDAMYESSPTAVLRRILKETHFLAKSTQRGDTFVYDTGIRSPITLST